MPAVNTVEEIARIERIAAYGIRAGLLLCGVSMTWFFLGMVGINSARFWDSGFIFILGIASLAQGIWNASRLPPKEAPASTRPAPSATIGDPTDAELEAMTDDELDRIAAGESHVAQH